MMRRSVKKELLWLLSAVAIFVLGMSTLIKHATAADAEKVTEVSYVDIMEGDGSFEDVVFNDASIEDTGWNWLNIKKYVGEATFVDDENDRSPSGGKYLRIEATGLDANSDNKPDQPVIQWRNWPKVIEGSITYTVELYLRRTSDYYPNIILQERKDSETITTTTLKTDGKTEGIPAVEKNVWTKITYEYTTQSDSNKLLLSIYGNKYAADVSFDVDGIQILKKVVKEVTPSEQTFEDIMEDDGSFENVTINTDVYNKTSGWNWNAAKYVGAATIVEPEDTAKSSPAGGKYLRIEDSGKDSDESGKVDQPVLKWRHWPYAIEGGETYTLELWIKRTSDYYPYFSLQERKDSEKSSVIANVKTDGTTEGVEYVPRDVWTKVTYEFTAKADSNRLFLAIYGGKEAGDLSFEVDGIRILKAVDTGSDNTEPSEPVEPSESVEPSEPTEPDYSNLVDIMEGDGSFENVVFNTTSIQNTGWNWLNINTYKGIATYVDDENDRSPSGGKYLRIEATGLDATNDGNLDQPVIQWRKWPKVIEGGKTYIVELYLRRTSDYYPYIVLQERKNSEAITTTTLKTDGKTEGIPAVEKNVWTKITYEYTTQSDSNKLLLAIYGNKYAADVSFEVDGIRILGEPPAPTAGDLWKERLEKEKAESKQVIADDGDPTEWKEPFGGTPANYLINSSFDTDVSGWSGNSKTTPEMYKWVSDGNGGGYIEIENKSSEVAPAVGQVVDDIIPEAEYQIYFKYKIDPNNTVTTPFIDIECFADTDEPGDSGYLGGLELRYDESSFIKDGQWHEYSYRTRVPLRTDWVQVFIRHTKNGTYTTDNYAYGAVCFDDVTFTMTNAASVISLNEDLKFLYRDMPSTELKATVKTAYYPEYADGNVVFEVFDGQNSVYKSEAVSISDGVACNTIDLSLLQNIDKPYCVKATLFDNGVERAAVSKNIYIYDRPAAINQNGEYVKFGLDFVPVIGYHVYDDDKVQHYSKVGEGGINVVQTKAGLSADRLVAVLDKLHENGLKGMVCLYAGMLPAGNNENVDLTIEIVSDERIRNHPAMFGYNVMDEPFIHQLDPRQDLENSYRLIRQYDKDNVIMFVEDIEVFIPESSSYVDALILDPYYEAAGANVYKIIQKATTQINFKKPLWSVLSTYTHDDGHFNTSDDVRNNNYQALLAGIDGLGYYSISDSGNNSASVLLKKDPAWQGLVHSTSEGYIPLWEVKIPTNLNAGAEIWDALKSFTEHEIPIIGDYFVGNNGTELFENINLTDGYMYHSWTAEDGKTYLVVLDVAGKDITVDIPLETVANQEIGAYRAKLIAGRAEQEDIIGKDSLNLTLYDVEALLFEIVDEDESILPVEIIPEGTDTSYTIASGAAVSIHCTGELEDLERVEVDGNAVDASNYTSEEGSTIVTFKTTYLDTLSVGEHKVTLGYTGGRSADSILTVLAKVAEEDDQGKNESDSGNSGNGNGNVDDGQENNEKTPNVSTDTDGSTSEKTMADAAAAQTGDYNYLAVWGMLMLLAVIAVTISLQVCRRTK